MSPEHLPGKPHIGLLTEGAEELMMLRNGLWSQRALNLNKQAPDQPVDRKQSVGIHKQALTA